MVSSIERFHCIQYSQVGPNSVLYREVQRTVYTFIRTLPSWETSHTTLHPPHSDRLWLLTATTKNNGTHLRIYTILEQAHSSCYKTAPCDKKPSLGLQDGCFIQATVASQTMSSVLPTAETHTSVVCTKLVHVLGKYYPWFRKWLQV